MLIGSLKEPSHKSKIKEDVDLAGLSVPSLSLNLSNSSKLEPSHLCLINKSLLVAHYPQDVREDGIIGPYNIWPPLESVPKPLTLMSLELLDKPELVRELLLVP